MNLADVRSPTALSRRLSSLWKMLVRSSGGADKQESSVKNVLEEINMQLTESSGGFTKLWSWTRIQGVCRCYAWFRLVKLWTGMRYSDTRGLSGGGLRYLEKIRQGSGPT